MKVKVSEKKHEQPRCGERRHKEYECGKEDGSDHDYSRFFVDETGSNHNPSARGHQETPAFATRKRSVRERMDMYSTIER